MGFENDENDDDMMEKKLWIILFWLNQFLLKHCFPFIKIQK